MKRQDFGSSPEEQSWIDWRFWDKGCALSQRLHHFLQFLCISPLEPAAILQKALTALVSLEEYILGFVSGDRNYLNGNAEWSLQNTKFNRIVAQLTEIIVIIFQLMVSLHADLKNCRMPVTPFLPMWVSSSVSADWQHHLADVQHAQSQALFSLYLWLWSQTRIQHHL